ncbi:bifunctional 3'-5' exonuclease/ATP-dependent helicase WRN-like [Ostrea edulis]|uniref:bifunctional 3'-5' exonuclease/ATP-dependent helicase WRN-like n=1 Tax=Ostrea edulis TaxID=37623 RepID=UPI0024AEAA08|nr:bifunctional 3'-5' exonuclease/ATP-dependent helicase WRN-like [Ostrea edulis]
MNESERFEKHLRAAKKELGVSFELKDRQCEALQALYNGLQQDTGKDQVLSLRRRGLMACFLDIEGTGASTCPIETLIDKKEIGKMLRGRTMQKLVCAIAVDEVHMISEWGKEFRKSFSRLGQLTSMFPNIPHLALTATSTSADLKLLSKTLDFRETHYIIANPDRPYIFIEIRRRLPNIKKFEKYDALLGEISPEFEDKLQEFPVTIVYSPE